MDKSGTKWLARYRSWAAVMKREAPVGFETDTPENSPNETKVTDILTAFTSLVAFLTTAKKFRSPLTGKAHVSRQSPNPRRRKRTAQGPVGIQARHRREIQHAILHHELRREGCSSVLLMPQLLRESAQIKGEVAVTGNLTHLIVRNLEQYRKEIEEQPFTPEDEKTLDELGI